MKAFIPLTLLVAGATAVPADGLDKRQFAGLASLLGGAEVKKAVVFKKLQPEYKANATRAVYMYGPFKLPPSTAKHAGIGFSGGIKLDPNSDTPGGAIEPPCKDCTVHKAMANFAYKDGKQADVANGVYVHHIIIVDTGGKMQIGLPMMPTICPFSLSSLTSLFGGSSSSSSSSGMTPKPPSSGGMTPKPPAGATGSMPGMTHSRSKRQSFGFSVFVGGGGSMGSGNPFSAKPPSKVNAGYWIGPGGGMQLTSELINYDSTEKDIYLTLDVEWSPGKDPEMLDVGMGALNADSCGAKEVGFLHPPKDKAIVYKGEAWNVFDTGYLMNFTPHIHDGGVNIKVFVNNKEVCESRAVYGDSGGTTNALDGKKWQTITGYTPCEDPVPIKPGDKVYMTSEYDLTKYRLRPDNTHADAEAEGMALANYIFAKPFPKSYGSSSSAPKGAKGAKGAKGPK